MKSPNMISTTGRMPMIPPPNRTPASASSEIGVSTTRSGPKRSTSPSVTLKTPPAVATSSPMTTTAGSAASSSAIASQSAVRNSSMCNLLRLRKRCFQRGLEGRGDLALDPLLERGDVLGAHAVLAHQGAAREHQRVALAPVLELPGLAVASRVRARVADEAVGLALE